jgi:hypothetical protein
MVDPVRRRGRPEENPVSSITNILGPRSNVKKSRSQNVDGGVDSVMCDWAYAFFENIRGFLSSRAHGEVNW